MKLLTTFINSVLVTAVTFAGVMSLAAGGVASAQIPYDPNGTPTSTTPVFNQFTNVPSGVGDESDFVRLRPSNGDVTSTANNAAYVSTLDAVCNSGDKFDVHTYIHNGADPNSNNNGSGTAVAHNVHVAMKAPLNTTASKFTFTSTVSANNAASVTDDGVLNCGNKQVKLSLVPGTVKTYSKPIGWNGEADSAVNGDLKVGSRVHGSGDQWACWDDRIIVVYAVQVTEVPKTPPVLQCTLSDFTVDQDKRKVSVSILATAQHATVTGYKITWGDGASASTSSANHTYASSVEKATIAASFTAKLDNGDTKTVDGADCMRSVSFKPNTPPVTPPELPNTGPGSIVGLFAGVTLAGALAHRFMLGRRLGSR